MEISKRQLQSDFAHPFDFHYLTNFAYGFNLSCQNLRSITCKNEDFLCQNPFGGKQNNIKFVLYH